MKIEIGKEYIIFGTIYKIVSIEDGIVKFVSITSDQLVCMEAIKRMIKRGDIKAK